MGDWKIQYGLQERTLEEWELTDLVRTRQNMGADTVSLEANGRPVDASELFEYGSTVIIKHPSGERWFWGRVEPWNRRAGPESESHSCVLVNPWWYLTEKVFKQITKEFVGYVDNDVTKPPIMADVASSRIFLNQAANGIDKLTTGEQMRAVIQYAIDAGAPIQIGDITPDYDVYVDEVRAYKCDEVLLKMWRFSPDAVFYWDYTTEPFPTLHCKRHSELVAVGIDINAGNLLERVSIKPRPDWQRPYVLLQFERTDNGWRKTFNDIWPNPLPVGVENQFRGLEAIINLRGLQQDTTQGALSVLPIQLNNLDWWKARISWMDHEDIADNGIELSGFLLKTINGANLNAALVNELSSESAGIADWMRFPNGVQVRGQKARATCKAIVTYKDGRIATQKCTYDFIATNAVTGPYNDTQTIQLAEEVPFGLAKRIWESLQVLACEGSFQFAEDEVSGEVGMGNVVNFITPNQPGWANLKALVQTITERAVEGRTEITFGAPEHITSGTLLELLDFWRNRQNPQLNYRLGA